MFYFILNYHAINPGERIYHEDHVYAVTGEVFRQHLLLLKLAQYKVILLGEPLLPAGQPTVSLTFDDGHDSDIQVVMPLLEEFGFKASFFIPAEQLQRSQEKREAYSRLIEAGHRVGPHGYSHTYLNALKPIAQYRELIKARETFRQYLSVEPTIFALPGGKYNRVTLKLAKKAGYHMLLGTGFQLYGSEEVPFVNRRWTIKRHTSLGRINKVLQQHQGSIRLEQTKALLKYGAHRLIPNELGILLSYNLRKWF